MVGKVPGARPGLQRRAFKWCAVLSHMVLHRLSLAAQVRYRRSHQADRRSCLSPAATVANSPHTSTLTTDVHQIETADTKIRHKFSVCHAARLGQISSVGSGSCRCCFISTNAQATFQWQYDIITMHVFLLSVYVLLPKSCNTLLLLLFSFLLVVPRPLTTLIRVERASAVGSGCANNLLCKAYAHSMARLAARRNLLLKFQSKHTYSTYRGAPDRNCGYERFGGSPRDTTVRRSSKYRASAPAAAPFASPRRVRERRLRQLPLLLPFDQCADYISM